MQSEMKTMDKREIRREVRNRIKSLAEEQKAAAADRVFCSVEQCAEFGSARCVALYAAMWDELPTDEVMRRWSATGRRIVLPRVEGEVMQFYDFDPDRMQSGAFGIDEPQGDKPCVISEIDLIVVPARAFTLSGIRLGRGKGFYDKYMSLPEFRAYKVGVAFECQIFDVLPFDNHDIKVDRVFVG